MKWVLLAFFIVLAVRLLKALSERNTFATVLGGVYLKIELKTSLYRSLQPLLFVCIFLIKDQDLGNTCYPKELQVFKAMVLTLAIRMEGIEGLFFPVLLLFCLLLPTFVLLNLFVPGLPTCQWQWRFLLNVLVSLRDNKSRQVRAGYSWVTASWRL